MVINCQPRQIRKKAAVTVFSGIEFYLLCCTFSLLSHFNFMKRIFYFLATNIAIIFILSIVLNILGVNSLLAENNVDLNISSLLIFATVIGFGGAFISLVISKWMAKKLSGAVVITKAKDNQQQWLLDTVKKQATIVGIKMPEVAIFPSNNLNAFATGASKNKSLVALSSALLDKMNQNEIEAVLGHEMSHIANGDMITLTLIQGIVNTFVVFIAHVIGHIVDRMILKNERGHGIGFYITTIVAQIALSILASVIVMYFSRKREFVADTGGADLAGTSNMISALNTLAQKEPALLPDELTAFGISSGKKQGLLALWSSHPPIEARIKALEVREQTKKQT